jgi:hypothetical protein
MALPPAGSLVIRDLISGQDKVRDTCWGIINSYLGRYHCYFPVSTCISGETCSAGRRGASNIYT